MHFPANNRAITTGGYDYILNGNLRWNNNGSRITERKVEELTAEDNKDTGVFVVIAPDGKVGVQTGDDDTSWISVEGFLHDFLAYEQQAEEGARPKSHRRQTLPHGHPYREKAVFIFDEPEYAAELTILGIGYEEETTTDKEYEIKLTHVQYMLRFSKKQDETSADSRNGD